MALRNFILVIKFCLLVFASFLFRFVSYFTKQHPSASTAHPSKIIFLPIHSLLLRSSSFVFYGAQLYSTNEQNTEELLKNVNLLKTEDNKGKSFRRKKASPRETRLCCSRRSVPVHWHGFS